jgi:hypothetical protein
MHPEYAVMTTNERLFAAGLLGAFDAAARQRDHREMLRLLQAVELDVTDATRTVELILAEPRKCGF